MHSASKQVHFDGICIDTQPDMTILGIEVSATDSSRLEEVERVSSPYETLYHSDLALCAHGANRNPGKGLGEPDRDHPGPDARDGQSILFDQSVGTGPMPGP